MSGKHQHHDSPWHRAMDVKSKQSGVRQINCQLYNGEKEDTTFKKFLKASPAKTLLDYYANHWDRIMGIHYESQALDLVDYAINGKSVKPDTWGDTERTFKGGMDYLIFPLVARKLLMDVVSDMMNDMQNGKHQSNSHVVMNSFKLIAWGVLEFLRHAIGLMVMTAVVLATPVLLLADHDLVSKDYNKNLKNMAQKPEEKSLLDHLRFGQIS